MIGAFVGFSHLPVHWWALGLLFLSVLGFTIDVQAGGLGPWTVIGVVSLIAGSWWLYGGAVAVAAHVVGAARGDGAASCCSCSVA